MSTGTIRALRLHRVRSAWRTHVVGVELTAPDAGMSRAITVLLASRVLVWAAALGAIALFGVNEIFVGFLDPRALASPFRSALANHVFAPAGRWDGVWYLGIAHAGYYTRQATAFFPLYPLLVHVGGVVLGSQVLAGVLISLAGMVGAGCVLFALTRLELGEPAARTTVALLACFPTALFLSALYTESLFLLVSVGAVYAARRERWAVAGLLGALASATRSTGLLLVIPLAIMFLYGPRARGARAGGPRAAGSPEGGSPTGGLSVGGLRVGGSRPGGEDAPGALGWAAALRGLPGSAWWRPRFAPSRSLLWIALVPVGIVAYLTFLAVTHGAPLAPFQAESYWGRAFAGPFGAVLAALTRLPDAITRVLDGTQHPIGPGAPLGWEAYQLIDLPFLAFAVAGMWMCVRRLPFAYTAYALVLSIESLSYPTHVEPLESFSRYLLVIFPLFMGWGAYLSRRRWARRVTLSACAIGLTAFSALWGTWAWVA